MSGELDGEYCFVAKDALNRSVEIDVRPHDDIAKDHYLKVWQKLASAIEGHHKIMSISPRPDWTTWRPGEWCDQKQGYEGRVKYVAWIGDNLAGFLNVWMSIPSARQPENKVLYIEHLAAFPGNITTELWNRRFQHVGVALLAYAVLLSKKGGFDGRVGLHVAAGALGFYRRVNDRHGGRLFHPDMSDVKGPTKRGDDDRSKTYLEMTEIGAAELLEDYRRG